MNVEQCPRDECRGLFTVSLIGVDAPGGRESEPIDCPHCGVEVRSERTAGVFKTHTATAEQAAVWLKSQNST